MSLKLIKIFVSHSSDTEKECGIIKDIIREESALHYEREGYKLEPFCWDDIPRGIGDPQEDLIDPYIKNPNCSLVVMVFWTVFGQPTGKYASGMEHEYELVKTCRKHILMFFGNKNTKPFAIDPKQLEKVQLFKKRVESERHFGHCGHFQDEEEFKKLFRAQLVHSMGRIKTEIGNLREDFERLSRGF